MKRLLFLLLLSPLALFAQKAASPNADRITVVNTNTAYANFIDSKLMLGKAEIPIASQDKDYFQVKTANVAIGKETAMAYFIFDCRDDKIMITGMWNSGATTPGATSSYVKIESNTSKLAFEKMTELAKKLGTKLVFDAK